MADDRNRDDTNDPIDPEDVNSDPADQVPVPPAMSAAEIDERAQAVDAVRGIRRESDEGMK